MNILKTPQQKLLEEAGAIPGSPGMLNTPKQMLLNESGIMPRFADGGQVEMSPQDMLAALFINNIQPEHLAAGGRPEETSPELARLFDRIHTQRMYSGEMPPEPTFQAQPSTATSFMRDKFAGLVGEKPADRLFGTGSEGQRSEYLPLQFLNPISAVTETIDAVPSAINSFNQGDTLGAGITAGAAGLGTLPFVKPVKHLIKKIKRK
jgi:hypothetical protein